MAKRIKFTTGSPRRGYKTLELIIDGDKASYKILRSGLLELDTKSATAQMSEAWLAELDALNIFAWEENYTAAGREGVRWRLSFEDGEQIYRGQGSDAYPDDWERFTDWLDAAVPELEFINRKRLERVTFTYLSETLTLDRRTATLTICKKNSRHTYDAGENIRKLFNACRNLLDGADTDIDLNVGNRVTIETLLHDGSAETFETLYNENFLPGLALFLELIRATASDLTAELFEPDSAQIRSASGKYILCKVQFKGSYKPYTYRTDDATLAVGDEVDVPVGKNNDVAQARIVDIGIFDDYELPYPLDKIKTIIGKHIAAEWENY